MRCDPIFTCSPGPPSIPAPLRNPDWTWAKQAAQAPRAGLLGRTPGGDSLLPGSWLPPLCLPLLAVSAGLCFPIYTSAKPQATPRDKMTSWGPVDPSHLNTEFLKQNPNFQPPSPAAAAQGSKSELKGASSSGSPGSHPRQVHMASTCQVLVSVSAPVQTVLVWPRGQVSR